MQDTKKIIVHLEVGYGGMDTDEGWIVPVTMTDDELSDFCWQRACDHAEMYDYYPPNDDADEEDEPAGGKISANIEGSWKDYDVNKHAGKISYGIGGPQFNEY